MYSSVTLYFGIIKSDPHKHHSWGQIVAFVGHFILSISAIFPISLLAHDIQTEAAILPEEPTNKSSFEHYVWYGNNQADELAKRGSYSQR